ncbi:MAG: dephospho-CoA kinase [Eubacteriaceae bacterium]|nr:dephospho-CoA kinase [Eubacteriaceae bacterium]
MKIIGVTGGIATGKSTVCRILAQKYGHIVVDADQISREVSELPYAQEAILSSFENCAGEDGRFDRKKLASIVFSDTSRLEELEKILHPLISSEFKRQAQVAASSGVGLLFYDCPLLFEKSLDTSPIDAVLLVYATEVVQIQRLLAKGFSLEDANGRIAAQIPIEEKRGRATWIIDNTSSFENLESQVDEFAKMVADYEWE